MSDTHLGIPAASARQTPVCRGIMCADADIASMRTTVTLSDAHEEHLDAIREQEDEPDAAVVRRCVERSQRLTDAEQRVDELETEVEHKQAEIDDLNRKLQEAHSSIETTNELVKRVDSDLSARERKQRAGVVQRAKWWLTGMDSEDNSNE